MTTRSAQPCGIPLNHAVPRRSPNRGCRFESCRLGRIRGLARMPSLVSVGTRSYLYFQELFKGGKGEMRAKNRPAAASGVALRRQSGDGLLKVARRRATCRKSLAGSDLPAGGRALAVATAVERPGARVQIRGYPSDGCGRSGQEFRTSRLQLPPRRTTSAQWLDRQLLVSTMVIRRAERAAGCRPS